MIIGTLPFADTIDDGDVFIISKDGVHLYQASAAGLGGGLRYWVETEDEIYREADITALSALVYDPTAETYNYIWHGAPMTAEQITKAVYTALDSTGKQPDWLFPSGNEKLDQTASALHFGSTSVKVDAFIHDTLYTKNYYAPTTIFHYSKDFPKLYVGYMDISITAWGMHGILGEGGSEVPVIDDIDYEGRKWYRTTPQAIVSLVNPGQTVSYNGHDFYVALKDAINEDYANNPETYALSTDPAAATAASDWIDSMNGVDQEHPSGQPADYDYTTHGTKASDLLDDLAGKIGAGTDPLAEPGQYTNEDPGSVLHNFYDRRVGAFTDEDLALRVAALRESTYNNAISAWNDAYDPVSNPEPGGYDNAIDYANYMVSITVTSGGGGGNWPPIGDHDKYLDGSKGSPGGGGRPYLIVMSCVGYYPDYELSHILKADDREQELHFPVTAPYSARNANFPGFARPSGTQTISTIEAAGAIANFTDMNNAWSTAPGTDLQRLLRGDNICVDYKDDDGYVWEIGFFRVMDACVDEANKRLKLDGGHILHIGDLAIDEVPKIEFDSIVSFNHWSYTGSWAEDIEEGFVLSRASDGSEVNVYKYSIQSNGAGEKWLQNARNQAAGLVNTLNLKKFKAYEGNEIKVRTNIGVDENEGFKTGIEVTDYDNVKKFDPTSYVDPVTGAAWFKGSISENGKLLSSKYQKKLRAGTGVTITPGTDYDTISMGGSGEVDALFELLENGDGITPVKDNLNHKIQHVLKHDVDADSNQNIISVTRTHKRDQEQQLTNEIVDTIALDETNLLNKVYGNKMIEGKGITLTKNTGIGSVKIDTTAITEIRVNGEAAEKHDSANGYYVDISVSGGGGGDDFDIPLPIPDYENREVIYASVYSSSGMTYTAHSDGVLYLMAHISGVCCLPVNIDGITYNLGIRASNSSFCESGNMLPLKEGQVVTFGTRYPSNGWVNSTSQNGYILWFIPFETVKNSQSNGTYILPSPVYSANPATITSGDVPSTSSGNYYTYTSPVDGIMRVLGNASGYYTVEPLDDNDASVGLYYLNHVNSSGEGLQFDYFPIRKGKKYKLQRNGVSKGNIVINAFKTVSDIDDLYAPYCDYANPIIIAPTADGDFHDIYDGSWSTKQPGLLLDTITGTYNFMASNLYIKEGNASDLTFVLQTKSMASSNLCDSSHNNIPLTRKIDYNPTYKIAMSEYGSGSIKVIKYEHFEAPVTPKRILYDGVNLVDSNGDVDLTFLKQLIDGLDARITALGG